MAAWLIRHDVKSFTSITQEESRSVDPAHLAVSQLRDNPLGDVRVVVPFDKW